MPGDPAARSVATMKRTLAFSLLALALLVLAVGGWAIQGVRWAATGGRPRRRLATA